MSIIGYEIYKDGVKQGNIQGTTKRRELDKLRLRYKVCKIKHSKK